MVRAFRVVLGQKDMGVCQDGIFTCPLCNNTLKGAGYVSILKHFMDNHSRGGYNALSFKPIIVKKATNKPEVCGK